MVYNKFKALGYKEENIDEKCTLFFKSNNVLLVRDGKDITELNLDNAGYIAISKCSKMRIIRIKSNVMENIAKYYIDENNNIISSSCTCPYYLDKEHNCKHIYALLYKVKCSENKGKIITEINNQISGIKTIVKNATDYINRNKSHFSYSAIDEFNNYSQQYISQTNYYEKNCSFMYYGRFRHFP